VWGGSPSNRSVSAGSVRLHQPSRLVVNHTAAPIDRYLMDCCWLKCNKSCRCYLEAISGCAYTAELVIFVLYLQSRGRGFDCRSGHGCVMSLAKLFVPFTSLTKEA